MVAAKDHKMPNSVDVLEVRIPVGRIRALTKEQRYLSLSGTGRRELWQVDLKTYW
jgi:hypothetical protein